MHFIFLHKPKKNSILFSDSCVLGLACISLGPQFCCLIVFVSLCFVLSCNAANQWVLWRRVGVERGLKSNGGVKRGLKKDRME